MAQCCAVAKHVPKFLQAHSHLLHKGPKPDEPRIVKEQEDSDIEDYDGVRPDAQLSQNGLHPAAAIDSCERRHSHRFICSGLRGPQKYTQTTPSSQHAGCLGSSDRGQPGARSRASGAREEGQQGRHVLCCLVTFAANQK